MPIMKPKSPMRLARKALFAAFAAESRVNQWPMSRLLRHEFPEDEHHRGLFASTMPNTRT
jgi:hypothetical protein